MAGAFDVRGLRTAVADNRVGQAARLADDRHRAVLQAVHLVQAAGLEAAGHEENVAAGLDAVGQGVGELQPHGDLLG